MATRFRVYIRGPNYERLGELTDWLSLTVIPAFNDVGTWSLVTSSETPEVALLGRSGGIIVTRTNDAHEPTTIFSGFVWTEYGYTATEFRASGYSDEALLWTPARPTPTLPAPPFADDYHVLTAAASTVMRTLVNVNIGPAAPEPWKVDALILANDIGHGANVTSRANLQPLLTLLAELAVSPMAGGLGFYLRQSDDVDNVNKVEFAVYIPPNSSADVKFSIAIGTISDYEDVAAAPEANHVYVMGGDGFGSNRTIIAEQDDASIAEWGRIISTVIDRRGVVSPSELNQAAAEAIAGVSTLRRTAVVPFDVPSLQYGTDYDLGTLVTIVTPTGEIVDLIRRVELELDPERGAIITPIVGQGDGSDEERVATITRTIQNRMSNLERNYNVPPDSIDATMLRADSVGPSELQANAVTEAKLDVLDAPLDNEILTYDGVNGRLEWQAINVLAANLSIVSLTVSGTSTLGVTTVSTLTASSTVQGTRLISTVGEGTAPLQVVSQTEVNNLNAEFLQGFEPDDFAAAADLANYVLKAGDAMTGALSIYGAGGGNDQVLFLRHGVGDGAVSLGANNSLTPDLIVKNSVGTQIASVTTAGVLLAGANVAVGSAGAGDAVVNDLWLVNGGNYRRLMVTGTTLQISGNASGGSVALTIFDDGLTQLASLEVLGATNLTGTLDVTGDVSAHGGVDIEAGGLGVSGASIFRDALTVQDGLTVQTGNLAVSNGGVSASSSSSFTGGVSVVNGDLATVGSSYVDHNHGSATSATISGWDGYVQMKLNGSIKRFYYKD